MVGTDIGRLNGPSGFLSELGRVQAGRVATDDLGVPARMKLTTRIASGGFGAVLVVAGLWVALISIIVGIVPQSPNPYAMDGDPCCAIPDTWAETREGVVYGLMWLVPGLAIGVTGALQIVSAVRGVRVHSRWLPIGVAAGLATAGLAIAITYARLDEAPQVTRCNAARERLEADRSVSDAQREQLLASDELRCRAAPRN